MRTAPSYTTTTAEAGKACSYCLRDFTPGVAAVANQEGWLFHRDCADRHDAESLANDLVHYYPDMALEVVRLLRAVPLLREGLLAIADPEHCLTAHTVDGLRRLARAALNQDAA